MPSNVPTRLGLRPRYVPLIMVIDVVAWVGVLDCCLCVVKESYLRALHDPIIDYGGWNTIRRSILVAMGRSKWRQRASRRAFKAPDTEAKVATPAESLQDAVATRIDRKRHLRELSRWSRIDLTVCFSEQQWQLQTGNMWGNCLYGEHQGGAKL